MNGDFFDIQGNGNLPYQVNNPMVGNGEFYKTTGNNAIGFKNDGSANSLVSGKPTKTKTMILAIYDDNDQIIEELTVEKLNTEPKDNETAVYFGTYNETKKYVPIEVNSNANIFAVEDAELALPNNANDFYGKGVITSTNSIKLEVGQFALVSKNPEVIDLLSVGQKIRVQYEFTGTFADVSSVTGHNANFLVDGEYSAHPNQNNNTHARHPRTVAGIKADGTIVLSVIDGRSPGTGKSGMYGDEMAAFMKSLGVVDAYNLDGGGSSYMIVKEEGEFVLKTTPSDGRQRSNGNALLIAVQVPEVKIDVNPKTNELEFDLNIINKNGFTIEETYLRVNGEVNKFIDGKVNFKNLNPDTEYLYELLYENKKGQLDTLMIDGKVKTLKEHPVFKNVLIAEDNFAYNITLEYTDPNNSSNLRSAILFVNGKQYTLQNNQLLLLKSNFKEIFQNFELIYTFNDNYNNYSINIENAPFKLADSPVTETLYDYFRIHNEMILDFYNRGT